MIILENARGFIIQEINMRTDEELVSAMHERAADLKREKIKRRLLITAGAAVTTASFSLLIFLAFWMPGVTGILAGEPSGTEMNASIFSASGAMGYLVIAVIAFLLGVSVTLFCFKLKQWQDSRGIGKVYD